LCLIIDVRLLKTKARRADRLHPAGLSLLDLIMSGSKGHRLRPATVMERQVLPDRFSFSFRVLR
jgi:hypothetical protein